MIKLTVAASQEYLCEAEEYFLRWATKTERWTVLKLQLKMKR